MFSDRQPADPATRILIFTNLVIFLLQTLAGASWWPVQQEFALTAHGLVRGELWRVVTYQFLHGNVLHIFVNMVALWCVGRELEEAIGTRRFVALYLIGGAVGGLAQIIATPGIPLIGASASVCAVMLAFTTLFARTQVLALLFFVLPVRMRAGSLGWLTVAATVAFWLSGLAPGIGHIAHLGGFAAGLVFGLMYRGSLGEGGSSSGAGFDPGPLPGSPSPALTLDGVTDKILLQGIDSLSREELRLLEQSRRPNRRR